MSRLPGVNIKEAQQFLQKLSGQQDQPARGRSRARNFFDGFAERASMPNGGFHGGQIDRITEEWRPGTIGPNRMVQMNGRLLRERAWDLYLNNPHAAAVVDAIIANVVECGIIPERTEEWERAWERWGGLTPNGKNHCDLSQDQTINELQATWLREVLVGGGCLVHYVTVDRKSQPIPLALELLGEDRFAEYLESWGPNPKTANPVYNGIEIDVATGRTVAYHIRKHSENDLNFGAEDTIRINADRAHYGYFKWKTGAKRGTTLLRACLMWLWSLGYYTDNELKNSDVKSTWAYMIQTSEGADLDWPSLSDSSPESGTTDIYGNRIEKLEGQQIFRGFPGDEIKAVGPNVPQSDSIPWIMLIQRSIAIGAKVSYEEAYRDYSKGSFSSVRAAMGSDRKRFRPMQDFAICHFCNPTVTRFDDTAVSNFANGFPSPSQWMQDREDVWDSQEWSTPGWESPNPKDDATAEDIRLKNGSINFKTIYGRQGKSWKKQFRQSGIERRDADYPPQMKAIEESAHTYTVDTSSVDNSGDGNVG